MKSIICFLASSIFIFPSCETDTATKKEASPKPSGIYLGTKGGSYDIRDDGTVFFQDVQTRFDDEIGWIHNNRSGKGTWRMQGKTFIFESVLNNYSWDPVRGEVTAQTSVVWELAVQSNGDLITIPSKDEGEGVRFIKQK